EFISCVLHGVAYCFNGKIKVVPEYKIAGPFGRGPVDWAILMGNKIIVITEAKKDDIEQGISQNTVQLHLAIQRNLRLRSSGGHTSTELYGIVTTALEWFIIKEWRKVIYVPIILGIAQSPTENLRVNNSSYEDGVPEFFIEEESQPVKLIFEKSWYKAEASNKKVRKYRRDRPVSRDGG
ncbi:hypothetical protein C1646_801792, partial [Rhizophagus diaphanus]